MGAVTTNAAALQGVKLNTSSLADTQVLTYDSASGTWMNKAASGGGSSTPRIQFDAPLWGWGAGNQYLNTTAGSPTFGLQTGWARTTCGASVTAYGSVQGPNGNLGASGFVNLTGSVVMTVAQFSGASCNFYLHWFSNNANPSVITANHIGLKDLVNTSGGETFQATNGNGTTSTATTISSAGVLNQERVVTWQWNVGTNVQWWVDDTLKVTSTTNLPTFSAAGGLFGIYNQENAGSGQSIIYLLNYNMQGDLR